MPGKATKEKCMHCNKAAAKELLACKVCSQCCHFKCIGITDASYKEINAIEEDNNDRCKSFEILLKDIVNEQDKKIENLEKIINQHDSKNNDILDTLVNNIDTIVDGNKQKIRLQQIGNMTNSDTFTETKNTDPNVLLANKTPSSKEVVEQIVQSEDLSSAQQLNDISERFEKIAITNY
ncbi:hypothetical protein HELRODRAFT_178538 [Helobdella robusta]|uniref:Uncharacterized protein n=1 Tax=Helobdella robusta TaxID=6412 RepID=T1FDC1_HELRO|nr:hypothetical protein HELRODRAFT_178538 [Helobdella robusta]ESN97089.1 hypothetical protein HELRODRAFT_178538 [Helobdella robusta]